MKIQWTPISEKQPPNDKPVLLASRSWIDGGRVVPDRWHKWVHMACVKEPLPDNTVVTHWMHVPDPPN
jgi:hypothetical protein